MQFKDLARPRFQDGETGANEREVFEYDPDTPDVDPTELAKRALSRQRALLLEGYENHPDYHRLGICRAVLGDIQKYYPGLIEQISAQ